MDNKLSDTIIWVFMLGLVMYLILGCSTKSQINKVEEDIMIPVVYRVYIDWIVNPDSDPIPNEDTQARYFINRTDKFCKESGAERVTTVTALYKHENIWSIKYKCKYPKGIKVDKKPCPFEERYCEE